MEFETDFKVTHENDTNNKCKIKKSSSATAVELLLQSLKYFFGGGILLNLIVMVCANIVTQSDTININMSFMFFLGFVTSAYTTYIKYKLVHNPALVSSCNCDGVDNNEIMRSILKVISHKKGSILFNVPNSVFGMIFYSVLFFANYYQYYSMITVLSLVLSVVGSVYLWYVMIFEIKSICLLCMTIHIVNVSALMYALQRI